MTDATDDTTIDELNFDDYDIDGLLLDLNDEIGEEAEPPTESAFSERVTADLTLSYRDPDAVDYQRDPYLLEIKGHLWSFEIPLRRDDAEKFLQKAGGWHEEIGLDLTVEEAAQRDIDVSEYVTEADDE